MLAETDEGYRNLIKITSKAFLDGYYYKPRTDWELLERHHEGITATSGCLGGLVPQLILAGEEKAALEAAARFQDVFGRDHLFIELQDHGIEDDVRVFKPLLEIARRLQAPLLATNDSHYTHKEDAEAHDALLCVQTGALKTDAKRFKFDGDDFYIKSAAEIRDIFRELPTARATTRCSSLSAPTSRSSSARRSCRRSPCHRVTTRTRTCASSRCRVHTSATVRPSPRTSSNASSTSSTS